MGANDSMVGSNESAKILVVLVRGWTNSGDLLRRHFAGGELPKSFVRTIQSFLPQADVVVPDLPMEMFSIAEPEHVVSKLLRFIDDCMQESGYQDLILMGFSSGAPILRRAYCEAWGALPDGTVDLEKRRGWAPYVSRLILLSGITRGWTISTATPHFERFFAPILIALTRLVARARGGRPFILALKQGAPFIVTGKLQYLSLARALENAGTGAPGQLAHTIYLLGSQDEFISPVDCIDLGVREEITYIEIPGSGHLDVLDIDSSDKFSRRRATLIRRAFCDRPSELAEVAIRADDIDDFIDALDRPVDERRRVDHAAVEHVVMIVHGIRDNGYWTKRIAREVKSAGLAVPVVVRAPTPSYGFFSMWDFIRTDIREDATYWLLERYADVRTYFPYAEVSFVGHSNGSYLAIRALEICPSVQFRNVVLAGSVVRTDFAWSDYRKRVGAVLNYVASNDFVVAFLPGAFERMGLRFLRVGGAGFFGFAEADDGQPVVRNQQYVRGGHGAAIGESFWREISRFVVEREWPRKTPADDDLRMRAFRPVYAAIIGWLGPMVVVAGGMVLSFLFYFMGSTFTGWPLALVFAGSLLALKRFVQFF